MKRHIWALALPLLSCLVVTSGEPGNKEPVLVGMAESMTADISESLEGVLEKRFVTLLQEFTGLNGKMTLADNPSDLARRLEEKIVHLGAFQGVEFAWIKDKHKDLKPLMVAVNQNKHPQALILVRQKSDIRKIEDLRGKVLAFPKKAKEHCRLFLERTGGGDVKGFFKELAHPTSTEAALNQVVSGEVDAVLVDKTAADNYAENKPGAYRQLRVLEKSEAFPATVIVYKEGAVDAKLLEKFREGMLKANRSERGREIMTEWNMTAFEPVPEDYQQALAAIAKAYPAPKAK